MFRGIKTTGGLLAAISLLVALMVVILPACTKSQLPKPGPLSANISLSGYWDSNWGVMKLEENGSHLAGSFDYCEGCAIEGTVDGDLFMFNWVQPGNIQAARATISGKGWMRISPDGTHMDGQWGYNNAMQGGGTWTAARATDILPQHRSSLPN